MKEFSCTFEFMNQKDDGKLVFTDDDLCCVSMFEEYALPYTDVTSFEIENYRLVIQTEQNTLTVSKLGEQMTAVYSLLQEKYNETVLKAFFIDEQPIFKTNGEYRYSDESGSAEGKAEIRLYMRCLCILPQNDGGRRIPLCFVRAIDKGNYRHKLTLDTGETYEIIRLGGDTQPFDDKLNECMYNLRQNAVNAALYIDPTLNTMQSFQVAKLMPEGAAAPLGKLSSISLAFSQAIEDKIKNSRANETYLHFKEVCDNKEILVGTKSNLGGEAEKDVLWIVAPKLTENGGVAAVEMALSEESAAATFMYRFHGEWEAFWRRLNHAIEAINFRREVITLTDEELNRKEYAYYKMAVVRTAALRFLRKCFAGRIIHSTMESWKQELNARFN